MVQTRIQRLRKVLASMPLVFCGSACLRIWIRSILPFLPSNTMVISATSNIVFDGMCGLSFLIIALTAKRFHNLFCNRIFLIISCIVMCVASFMLIFAYLFQIFACYLLFAILGSIGFTALSLAWIELYTSFNPVCAVLYFCAGRIVGEALTFVFAGYRTPYLFGIILLLPILGVFCLWKSGRHVSGDSELTISSAQQPFPWKPALFLSIYTFAYSIADSTSGVLSNYPEKALYLIPPIVFFFSIALNTKRFTLKNVYIIICPLMMCALLFPVAIPGFSKEVSAAFIGISYNTSGIMAVLIIGSISHRLGISALWLFGIVRACSYSSLVGGAVCFHLAQENGNISPLLSVLLAISLVIVSILLLTEKSLNSNWGIPAIVAQDQAENPLGQTIAQLKEVYRLTDREEEIIYLLAQKKTVAAIASEMFVAQGTIKSHVQHIYQKLRVHSRKELFTLLQVP